MQVTPKHLKIGERLRRLRLKARRKQKEVADALGLDASTLCLYEQGRREWTPELVQKYKEALA